MQLRTEEEFSRSINSDFTWRIKEISDLRTLIRRSERPFIPTVVRAGIPLIYAHWEGHVGVVSKAYMGFLATRKLNYATLKAGFRLNEFLSRLSKMEQVRSSQDQKLSLLRDVILSGTRKLRKVDENVLSSRSNLNSSVLSDVCAVLCLDADAHFSLDYDFIDHILLARRNQIAHGEPTPVDADAFREMSERVVVLMRKFNNLVENDVVSAGYRA